MYGSGAPLPLSSYGNTTGTITVYLGGGYVTNLDLLRSDPLPRRHHPALRLVRPLPPRIDVMACEGHRMPPVGLDLATLPLPLPAVIARLRAAPWLRRANGGPRERASHRRRLRAWER